jgi:hypothetical protein
MVSFRNGPMYSADGFLSASSEQNVRPTNRSSSTYTTSYFSLQHPRSEMPEHFSAATSEDIRRNSNGRCVLCQTLLTDLGHCAHILDAAEAGKEMASYFFTTKIASKVSSVCRKYLLSLLGCSSPRIGGQLLRTASSMSGKAFQINTKVN